MVQEQTEQFVSFGEQGAQLTYGSYLRLPQLLDSQHLESDPPAHDELLFITIHQVYELWFKQLLHEADGGARRDVRRGELWWAQHLLQRVHVIERVLVHQVDVLETMTPQDFLEFRQRLAPASGFQSVQFRELEFLSGAKDPSYVDRFRGLTEAEQARLDTRLAEPTLWDAFLDVLRASGLAGRRPTRSRGLAADGRPRPLAVRRGLGPRRGAAPARRAGRPLAGAARDHGRADDRRKSGTGGSSGAPYLRAPAGAALLPAALGPALRALTGTRPRRRAWSMTTVSTTTHDADQVRPVTRPSSLAQAGKGTGGPPPTGGRAARGPTTGTSPPRTSLDRTDVDVYGAFAVALQARRAPPAGHREGPGRSRPR